MRKAIVRTPLGRTKVSAHAVPTRCPRKTKLFLRGHRVEFIRGSTKTIPYAYRKRTKIVQECRIRNVLKSKRRNQREICYKNGRKNSKCPTRNAVCSLYVPHAKKVVLAQHEWINVTTMMEKMILVGFVWKRER